MISLSFLKKSDEEFDDNFRKLTNSISENSSQPNFLLLKNISNFLKTNEFKLIKKAYMLSKEKHSKQKRASGEPYFTHLFQTAYILSEYGADTETITAALLHDILEDTKVTAKEIKELFGDTIYSLVKGVTKLSKISKKSREEELYLKHIFIASTKDIRVLVIKLADKLHNIRTLKYLDKNQRYNIAKQALEVYVPLAHKLGLHEIEHEMQELCFKELNPEKFKELKKITRKKYIQKKKDVIDAIEILKKQVKKEKKNYSFEITKKDLYSVYRKTLQTKTIEQLHDFYTLIILTNTARECYDALGLLHSLFKPIPRKVKDLIALPTMDTYSSIHSTVIGPHGRPIKAYIRTKTMHELAKKGVIFFFNDKKKLEAYNKKWQEIASIVKDSSLDNVNLFEAVKSDVLCVDIDVYNGKGSHYKMPCNSTVMDFAYTVYPKKAAFISNVMVNQKLAELSQKLETGDIVEFSFGKEKTVKKEWLSFALTFDARKKIAKDLKNLNED